MITNYIDFHKWHCQQREQPDRDLFEKLWRCVWNMCEFHRYNSSLLVDDLFFINTSSSPAGTY